MAADGLVVLARDGFVHCVSLVPSEEIGTERWNVRIEATYCNGITAMSRDDRVFVKSSDISTLFK